MMADDSRQAPEVDDELATSRTHPVLDFVLGALVVVEAIWWAYFNLATDSGLLLLFCGSVCAVIIAILGVKSVFGAIGDSLSRMRTGCGIPPTFRHPLASSVTRKKWCDQAWQLAIHVSMTCYEVWLLFGGGGGNGSETWWVNPDLSLQPCPVRVAVSPITPLRVFYVVQLSIWFVTAVSCKFLEARRKDYVEMMLHHIMTIALVMNSFYYNELAFGLVVLFIHDASDVILDIMKMANYMKLEDGHGFFITEVAFVLNTYVIWPYLRMYTFPIRVLPTPLFNYERMCPGQSKYMQNAMLVALFGLHCFWWYILNRIAYKMMCGQSPNSVGEQEYESRKEQ